MTHSAFSLKGKTALVTGATRGLGFEIAKGMAEAGGRVLVNGRTADSVDRAVAALSPHGSVTALVADVTAQAEIRSALDKTEQADQGVDILVNNVGIRNRRPLFEFQADMVRDMLEANLVAPFLLSREVARAMKRRGGGRIINITSIAGPLGRVGDAAYIAAKGGLEALTRALAAELGPHNINVNAIAPGFFGTEPNRELVADAELTRWLANRTSLGRWGDPSEIAGAAVFLASPAASYISGHLLVVDGGFLTHY